MGDKQDTIDAPAPCHNVVKVAQEGFGKNAAEYDEHRPSYTAEIVELVLGEIAAPTSLDSKDTLQYEVLELGAGTGKFTELVAPKMPSGYRYMATEPSQNFLAYLKAKSLPIETANASASRIPLPDNSVKNILCAQCLHWFSTEESLKEMHRVLIPGGKLIAVWNVHQFEEGKWTIELYKQRFEVMEQTGYSTLYWVNSMEWKKALDACKLFSCAKHESLPGIGFHCDLDKILKNLRTISCYNTLPPDDFQACSDRLKEAILRYPGVNPDELTQPYASLVYVFQSV